MRRSPEPLNDAPDWGDQGAVVAPSLDEALAMARQSPGGEQVWVIGGGQVYREAVERGLVDVVEVTEIDVVVDGDTFAPTLDPDHWHHDGADKDWSTSGGPQALRYRFDTLARH